MRTIICSLIVAIASTTVNAQSLLNIKDSCYRYLEQQDMKAFNNTFIQILDAAEKEADYETYSIRQELNKIRIEDQSIRLLLIDAWDKYGTTDPRIEQIRRIMDSIDSKNAKRVSEIIDTYGWLSGEEIGEDANEAIFLCIQHCNDSMVQSKYLPILKTAVEQGKAKGWHYAFLTDRILMNQGKSQIYGTQTITSNKKVYIVPLESPQTVDELRKAVGLETLSEYMKNSFGVEWSIKSYEEQLPKIEEVFKSFNTRQKPK